MTGSSTPPPAEPPVAGRTIQDEEHQQDTLSSETFLWLPRTVVRQHRRKATIIWISLLAAFLAYVAYLVWDTIDSRRDPASSFQLTQEHYSFPDVVICFQYLHGCLASTTSDCIDTASISMMYQHGFLEEEVEPNDASKLIEDNFDCKALPLSGLTVNQTGIDSGEINYFSAGLLLEWNDDPYLEYDPSDENMGIMTQSIGVWFDDLAGGVEGLDGETSAAQLPYDRVLPMDGEVVTLTLNYMVLDLTTFQSISSATGKRQKTDYIYTQATTSTPLNYYWNGTNSTTELSVLMIELYIPRFEYLIVEEVDPVDAWAIIGAIGGVWQFVIIAFGMFFVFSEKQAPDKKMRNFRKSVTKPASIVARRFSSVPTASSSQDVVLDATDEDLPSAWVKRQRKNGSTYYYNIMTGEMRDNSPREEGIAPTRAPPAAPPRRVVNRLFKAAHQQAPRSSIDFLPPGWIGRLNDRGRTYYENTVQRTTQWERPTQVADVPVSTSRRRCYSSSDITSDVSRVGDDVRPMHAPSQRNVTPLMTASAETSSTSAAPTYTSVGGTAGSAGGNGREVVDGGGGDSVAHDPVQHLPQG